MKTPTVRLSEIEPLSTACPPDKKRQGKQIGCNSDDAIRPSFGGSQPVCKTNCQDPTIRRGIAQSEGLRDVSGRRRVVDPPASVGCMQLCTVITKLCGLRVCPAGNARGMRIAWSIFPAHVKIYGRVQANCNRWLLGGPESGALKEAELHQERNDVACDKEGCSVRPADAR